MKKDKLIPKRRFKEFKNNEAWEQRKVEDLGNIVTGSTPLTLDATNYGGDYLFVSPADIQENRYVENTITTLSEKGFKKGRILKEGSTLFVSIGSTIGKVAQIKGLATTNQQINSIEPTEKYNDDFVYSLMKNKAREIKLLAATQAVPIINKTLFSQVSITVPSNINEQERIGSFFKDLDNLITLHQRKLKKLKELKLAYLSEMFPEEGEKYPKRRFAGFTEPWEQHKLNLIADRFDNLRIPVTESNRILGTTPYYGANGILDYVDGFTHDGEYVLIAEDGANDLNDYPVHYVNGKVWVNNHAHVIQAKEGISDNRFLQYSFKTFNIEPYLVGGSRAKLNANIMMDLIINTPEIEEQIQIGKFFKDLDNLITLHQRKLEKLQNIKKAYLNEMFV
ncbi:restriction endonuclease subunit S [Clostridium cochlearium]|uniref:Restriction modification system DNA specificity domain-containing protein n=1 Tax=Clostridium cochlearium TaxID=1494 RepID=A0A2X2W7R7_CLOCO|nr:restriction endonuclease subunit S [Clostridium cochlearium]SQB35497.1 restriction modification system DNA specificity domain-containing protein [Clostridium cochlearium]